MSSRRSRPMGVAGALLVFVLPISACRPESPLLTAQQRLHVAGESLEPEGCSVRGERRPALGCLPRLRAREFKDAREGAIVVRKYAVPEQLRGGVVVARRSYSRHRLGPLHRLPSLLLHSGQPRIPVALKVPPDAEANVELYEARPTRVRRTTEPVSIPPGALLVGGVAVDTARLKKIGPPIVFTLVAKAEGDAATLLHRRVVDPRNEGDRWLDYRLDLARFAGRKVAFVLSTRPAPDAPAGDGGRSFPLWSVPVVLAPAPIDDAPRHNVLIVSIDTLRADHVGAYGSALPTTPHLDRFAADSTVFETAMATFPSTTASHMSLFTGLYPNVHGVTGPLRRLDEAVPTLAQTLSKNGFATAAVTENGMIHSLSGFARGFDSYRELRGASALDTPGRVARVVTTGLAWLREHRDQRSLLFLHTYQVHSPYEPLEAFDRFDPAPGSSGVEKLRAKYAGEVLYTDSEIARLIDGVEQLGLLDRTVFIVTSDHGEGFGEHSIAHGTTLHEEELRVPLIIRAPGLMPTGRVPTPVSLVDVLPTVLALSGIQSDSPVQGRSLVTLVGDSERPGREDRAIFAERSGEVAVRMGDRKWIVNERGGARLYDLGLDPTESAPLMDRTALEPGLRLVDQYRHDRDALLERLGDPRASEVEIDEDTRRELRALGYGE